MREISYKNSERLLRKWQITLGDTFLPHTVHHNIQTGTQKAMNSTNNMHTHIHTHGFCLAGPFFQSYSNSAYSGLGQSPKANSWEMLCQKTFTDQMPFLSPNQQHFWTQNVGPKKPLLLLLLSVL